MKVWIKFPIEHSKVWEITRPEQDSYRGFWIHSRAKVCPHCLQIWATRTTEKGGPWSIEGQSCAECNESHYCVAGSLLEDRSSQTFDLDLIRYLPLELQQREFDLHVRALQKDSQNEQPPTDFSAGIGIAQPFVEGGPNPGHYHGALPPSGS